MGFEVLVHAMVSTAKRLMNPSIFWLIGIVCLAQILLACLAFLSNTSTSSPSADVTPASDHAQWGVVGNASNIAIFTMAQGEHDFKDVSIENKRIYARRHGYEPIVKHSMFEVDPSMRNMHPTWGKVGIARYHLRSYDWMWLIDLDALVMNHNITLQSIIAQAERLAAADNTKGRIDIIIGADCTGINAGSILIRNSEFTNELLPVWLAMEMTSQGGLHYLQEQQALTHIIDTNFLNASAHVQIVPMTTFNSYPDNDCNRANERIRFEVGDFVLHFVGVTKINTAAFISGQYMLDVEKIQQRWSDLIL